jgi:RHS repeat-associated protein
LDGAGITVGFGYDDVGNRTRVIDGLGRLTTFTYDGMKRLLQETTPGGIIVTNVYNELNKTSRTDAKGQVTTYSYDNRRRVESMNYAGTGKSRAYAYDAAGRLTGVGESDAPASAVGYAYDELGRTVSETSQGVVHLHTFDLAGRELVRKNVSTGRRIDRAYDAAGRLVSITEGGRNTLMHYDLAGRVVAKRMGNATWAGLNYDALGRVLISTTYQTLAQDAGQILFEHEWDYDLAGNVREQRETWPGAPGRTPGTRITGMDYDGAYRLTQEAITEPGGEMTVTNYTYDAANNRSTKTVTGGEEPGQWTYASNTLNQLTGYTRSSGTPGPSTVSYGYDANGNRTSRTADGVSDTYTWDAENRLIGVNKAGAQHGYEYDYRTRRISREEPASVGGGTEKTAVIFAGGLSVAEYGYTGATLQTQPTVEYVRGPDLGGGVGGLLYSLRSAGGNVFQPVPKYNYPNGRGDVVAQADQGGAVTWTASYEAFGSHKKETGTNADRQRANTKEEDPTGLLNEGFRYRDIETGTWLSRDPAGFVDGPNLYAYVQQNPWTKFDPDGLSWIKAAKIIKSGGDLAGAFSGARHHFSEAANSFTFSEAFGHTWAGLSEVLPVSVSDVEDARDTLSSVVDAGKAASEGNFSGAADIVKDKAVEKVKDKVTQKITGSKRKDKGGDGESGGGRRGSQTTREDVDNQRDRLQAENPDWVHTHGGTDAETGAPKPEKYIPGPDGKRGSTYPDLTFDKGDGTSHHHNTQDTYADNTTPTRRESANQDRLQSLKPKDTVSASPKPKRDK